MQNYQFNIYYINPKIFDFISHWGENEKKLAVIYLKRELFKYKKQSYFPLNDLFQDCLLAILENYQKNNLKFKFFHVQLLARQTLSNLFKKKSTKILQHYLSEDHVEDDVSIMHNNQEDLLDSFLKLAKEKMSEQEYELFEYSYILENTQFKIMKMLNITNHNIKVTNLSMKVKIKEVLLCLTEK